MKRFQLKTLLFKTKSHFTIRPSYSNSSPPTRDTSSSHLHLHFVSAKRTVPLAALGEPLRDADRMELLSAVLARDLRQLVVRALQNEETDAALLVILERLLDVVDPDQDAVEHAAILCGEGRESNRQD